MPYYSFRSYQAPPLQLGTYYADRLLLGKQQVLWLDKFHAPTHAFSQLEQVREATVLLFVAVLNQLEAQCKAAGSTLPKRVREVVDATARYDHVYVRQTYQYISRNVAGHKVGAAIFLTIYFHCENAVRAHLDFPGREANLYYSELNDPDQEFNRSFGHALPTLLASLATTLPAPSAELEQALNRVDPKRWQSRFAQLLALLPGQPAQFVAGVHALARQNEHLPQAATLYQQAAWQLAATGQPATLELYLHYLAQGQQRYPFKPKPLLKRMQKALLPLPEHLARFEALVQQLLRTGELPAALAALPTVFYKERRHIELNDSAIRTVRQQHAGTVELLGGYLSDEPAAAPSAVLAATPAGATALPLTTAQQALLALFAARHLTLTRAEVEALATAHGLLRHSWWTNSTKPATNCWTTCWWRRTATATLFTRVTFSGWARRRPATIFVVTGSGRNGLFFTVPGHHLAVRGAGASAGPLGLGLGAVCGPAAPGGRGGYLAGGAKARGKGPAGSSPAPGGPHPAGYQPPTGSYHPAPGGQRAGHYGHYDN